jgi:hypothetical protein
MQINILVSADELKKVFKINNLTSSQLELKYLILLDNFNYRFFINFLIFSLKFTINFYHMNASHTSIIIYLR